MTDLSAYMKELRAERASWLGQIVFWHVPAAARIAVADFQDAMHKAGLTQFAPPLPRLTNTFRSVSSKHARKGVPTDLPGVFENYKIEEVKRAERRVVKDIVVQRVDGNNEELSYDVQVRLEYVSTTNEVRYWWIGTGEENPQALNLADLIAQDFRASQGTYNSNKVRWILRDVLAASRATAIQGKAHFVSLQYADRVAGLELLSELIPEIGITAIPLNDSEKQRQMVREAYEAATVSRINGALSDLDKMQGQPLTGDQFAALLDQKDQLKKTTREYSELLSGFLSESEMWLTVYEKRVMQLLPQVRP